MSQLGPTDSYMPTQVNSDSVLTHCGSEYTDEDSEDKDSEDEDSVDARIAELEKENEKLKWENYCRDPSFGQQSYGRQRHFAPFFAR